MEPAPLALEHRDGEASPVFTEWAVGDDLFVASHLVNLRDAPSTSGEILHEMDMGMRVEILSVSKPDHIGVSNRWYEVRPRDHRSPGFVFGSLLTPERHLADLDGDGFKETVTLAAGPEFGARVRVLERHDSRSGSERDFLGQPSIQTLDIPGGGGTMSIDTRDGLGIEVCNGECVRHPAPSRGAGPTGARGDVER